MNGLKTGKCPKSGLKFTYGINNGTTNETLQYKIEAFESDGSHDAYFYLVAPRECDREAYNLIIEKMKKKGFVLNKRSGFAPNYENADDYKRESGWAMKFIKQKAKAKPLTRKDLGI